MIIHTVPKIILAVKTLRLTANGSVEEIGMMIATPYQPAAKFISSSDKIPVNTNFEDLLIGLI